MSPEAELDAKRAYQSLPEPELILLSELGQAQSFGVLMERITVMSKWDMAGALLASQASWAPPNGKQVNVFVQLPEGDHFLNRNWKVTLLPGNVAGFDLRAAYLERWGA